MKMRLAFITEIGGKPSPEVVNGRTYRNTGLTDRAPTVHDRQSSWQKIGKLLYSQRRDMASRLVSER